MPDVEEVVMAENYIGGLFEAAETYIDSYEPATGQVWAKVPNSGVREIDRAVKAAKEAFPAWRRLGVEARADYLLKVAALLEGRAEEFAEAEARDQGKPVGLAAKMDIPRAIHNLKAFAEGNRHLLETSNTVDEVGVLNYTTRSPLGVAGLIVPWNLPLYLLTFKLAPALVTGNTVVCKPSEMTSVTTWMLCKLFEEAGFPGGVVNVVHGYGPVVGEAIVRHPDVKVISFTGSTAVGRHIAEVASPMMKKLSLELGGKNAALVFPDADLDRAVPDLIRAAFLNQGEICLCTSRIFVHQSVHDEFLRRFREAVAGIRVGVGRDVFMGALVSQDHLDKVKGYVRMAVEQEGGQVVCGYTKDDDDNDDLKLEGTFPDGGPPAKEGGYFMRPTVITGLDDSSRVMREEIFGPVVCLAKFDDDLDSLIRRVNDVPYGLCASVWSESASTLHEVASRLEVGTVWLNCWLIRHLDMPFGGSKESGSGREGVHHSLETFTELKTCCLKFRK